MRHLNPVYKRELKQTARTKKTLVMLCIYNLLLAGMGLFVFYLIFDNGVLIHESIEYSSILTLYSVMTGMEFVMVLFIIPSVTAGAVAGEREKQTLDILLASGISPLQVVAGKLAASISTVILLAVSSLPVLSIVFSIGGITLGDMFQFILLIVVTAVYLGSIGIFFSVCCRKTTVAAVSSYTSMILLTFFLPLLLSFSELISGFSNHELFSLSQIGKCFTGKQSVFLLFNPMISFISMIRNQAGRGITLMSSIGSEGGLLLFLSKHWFTASMIFQFMVAGGLIGAAAHRLNPVAGKRERK